MLLGLRTVIYAAPNLAAAKQWYAEILGFAPYFDELFYVGFNVGGYELGLDPDAPPKGEGGVTLYWGVDDINRAFARLLEHGATEHSPSTNVGGAIFVATVLDPFGNILGIIENPDFTLP
jgi:predicted enzyme related to lactoylglutathione lyase